MLCLFNKYFQAFFFLPGEQRLFFHVNGNGSFKKQQVKQQRIKHIYSKWKGNYLSDVPLGIKIYMHCSVELQ